MNEKEIIKYLKEKDLDIQRAHAYPFICSLAYQAYANSETLHGAKFSPVFCFLIYKTGEPHYQFIDNAIIKGIGDKIYLDYQKNKRSIDDWIKRHGSAADDLDKIWERFKKENPENLSIKILLEYYEKLTNAAFLWWKFASVGEEKGRVIERIITANFAGMHKISLERAGKIVNVLSYPERGSVFSRERMAFYGIVLKIGGSVKLKRLLEKKKYREILENKLVRNEISEYIKKYFWIKADFCRTREVNLETVLIDASRELKNHKLNNIKNELKKIKNSSQKIKQEKIVILKKIKLNKSDGEDIYFASRIIEWVDMRKAGMLRHLHYLWMFFNVLTHEFNISYVDLSMHTAGEIKDLIKNNKKITKLERQKRDKGILMVFEKDSKLKIIYGEMAKKALKAASTVKDKNIQGTIASRGNSSITEGRVKIVMNLKKDKFKKDEILVTSMTRPEYVHLMRIAKAIITDEGGIASHAAIISRELGKPCFIGTKIATQILKNGDLVRIDTRKGTVTLLK